MDADYRVRRPKRLQSFGMAGTTRGRRHQRPYRRGTAIRRPSRGRWEKRWGCWSRSNVGCTSGAAATAGAGAA